jgi:hypothetical protein
VHIYPLNVAIMLALCPPLFLAARRATRDLGRRWRLLATALACGVLVAWLGFLWDGPLLADRLPADDVLAFGQWTPQLTAVLLGVAWPELGRAAWRRYGLATAAGVVAVVVATEPGWRPRPTIVDLEDGGCVRQTSTASCGAGATANLLRQHGIHARESEMAALCLTGVKGTWFHGMVRGLRIKCAGTPWRVRAGRATVAELAAGRFPGPVLLSVYLSPELASREPRYAGEWGWVVGQGHVVVLLRFEGDRPVIADSAIGFERWHRQGLEDLFTGRLIWLEAR